MNCNAFTYSEAVCWFNPFVLISAYTGNVNGYAPCPYPSSFTKPPASNELNDDDTDDDENNPAAACNDAPSAPTQS